MNTTLQASKPLTSTQIVDYAEHLLADRNRECSIRFNGKNIPTYEWPGAGSERAGSAGILSFDRVTFATSPYELRDDQYIAISVGRGYNDGTVRIDDWGIRRGEKMRAIFKVVVPEEFVDKVLHKHNQSKGERLRGKSKEYWQSPRRKLDYALSEFIRRNNREFFSTSLFVFDYDEDAHPRPTFFTSRYGSVSHDLRKEVTDIGDYDFTRIPKDEAESRRFASKLADILLNPRNFGVHFPIRDLSQGMQPRGKPALGDLSSHKGDLLKIVALLDR